MIALRVAILAGYALALLGWMRWRRAAQPDAWGLADAAVVLVGLVMGSGVVVYAWTGAWPAAGTPLVDALVGTAGASLLAVAAIRARASWAALGLVPPRARWVQPMLGCLALFLAASSLWALLLERFGLSQEQQLVTYIRDSWPSGGALAVVAYGVAAAPIVEELLFRGFLLPPLARRLGAAGGVVATASLFGLMHAADPAAVAPLVLLGALCGWLRIGTGSLWPPLALHVANNLLAMGLLFLGL